MPHNEDQITHVSDTALMAAACRAIETARTDGLVRDPFAEKLAGQRGLAIARGLPGWEVMCFGVGIRSRFMDELVTHATTALGIETVVSVGAGLDTRPWRLDLPPRLRWIEVDFPEVLDYKAAILAEHQPKCRLERLVADLNDAPQRQAVFAAAGSGRGLMITEGLLMYLPAATVEGLAGGSVDYWLLDVASEYMERRTGMPARKSIQDVRAASHLDGVQILDVLRRNGWSSMEQRSYIKDALPFAVQRFKAQAASQPAAEQLPPPPPDDPSGVHLFGRG